MCQTNILVWNCSLVPSPFAWRASEFYATATGEPPRTFAPWDKLTAELVGSVQKEVTKPLQFGPVVTTSIAKQIAERLREAIMTGHLRVGERLPTEDDLARRYGVSRPTIREALKRLAALSLIRSRRGPTGGNFVAEPDPASFAEALTGTATLLVSVGAFDFEEIATARLELEKLCCRLAAAREQPGHLAELEAALGMHRDPTLTDEAFCAADVRFHRALVEATGNGPIRFVMYAVIEAMLPIMNMIVFRLRERQRILEIHERIVAALRQREAERACEAVEELIAYLRGRYIEAAGGSAAQGVGAKESSGDKRTNSERPFGAPTAL